MLLTNLASSNESRSLGRYLATPGASGMGPISLWKQMGILAKIVVIILFIMSPGCRSAS
jgi:hypothetical protein